MGFKLHVYHEGLYPHSKTRYGLQFEAWFQTVRCRVFENEALVRFVRGEYDLAWQHSADEVYAFIASHTVRDRLVLLSIADIRSNAKTSTIIVTRGNEHYALGWALEDVLGGVDMIVHPEENLVEYDVGKRIVRALSAKENVPAELWRHRFFWRHTMRALRSEWDNNECRLVAQLTSDVSDQETQAVSRRLRRLTSLPRGFSWHFVEAWVEESPRRLPQEFLKRLR